MKSVPCTGLRGEIASRQDIAFQPSLDIALPPRNLCFSLYLICKESLQPPVHKAIYSTSQVNSQRSNEVGVNKTEPEFDAVLCVIFALEVLDVVERLDVLEGVTVAAAGVPGVIGVFGVFGVIGVIGVIGVSGVYGVTGVPGVPGVPVILAMIDAGHVGPIPYVEHTPSSPCELSDDA